MKAKRELRIASRASQLARIQAELVGDTVKQQFPNLDIKYVPVTTTGDRSAETGNLPPKNKDDFVRDIELLLVQNEADLAVHSLKDVPSKTPDTLSVHTVLQREDPRDVMVRRANVFCLDSSATIGTSSPRRRALLKFRFQTNKVAHIRGNVDTRLRKLDRAEYDSILLAAAGLHRLNLRHRIDSYLDPNSFIPAPCQGTLAVQFRQDDVYASSIMAPLRNSRVEAAARCERDIVVALKADCNSPIGIYCEDLGDEYVLHSIVLNSEGTETLELRKNDSDPVRLASNIVTGLIAMGVETLLRS